VGLAGFAGFAGLGVFVYADLPGGAKGAGQDIFGHDG